MTLPTSPISLSEVNVELLQSATALISLNDTNVRTLAGVASGQIGMSDLQGKTNGFSFTISADTANVNLRTAAVAAGWNQVLPVVATIGAGVNIYSTSTATSALTIDGTWAGGVTLVNNGNIVGKGGAGGDGGTSDLNNPPTATNGTNGSAGGKALAVTVAVSINNSSGVIGGGGGGGGGGAGVATGGSGGASSVINPTGGSSTNGGTGGTSTYTAGGSSGTSGSASINNNGVINSGYASCDGGSGGAGGTLGTVGNSGNSTGSNPTERDGATGGSGGAAGACLTGNSNITWIATGTRYGTIS